MQDRKQLEKEFHNRRIVLEKEQFEEYSNITTNKKFYSVAIKSRQFMYNWLFQRCRGKKVLDYCCGTGSVSMLLAQNGAQVTGIDISDKSIEQCLVEAKKIGVEDRTSFYAMDAENTRFEDNTFDLIVCSGVLHHMDIEKSFIELSRILRPDGEVFCGEPLKHNPIFQLYRSMTPHIRTEWETDHILRMSDVRLAKKYFKSVEYKFFNLAVLAAVPLRNTRLFKPALSVLQGIDDVILQIPYLNWMAWIVYFFLSKPIKR